MGIRSSRGVNVVAYILYHGVFGVVCKYNDGRLAYIMGIRSI
jgi:hypothetical protein